MLQVQQTQIKTGRVFIQGNSNYHDGDRVFTLLKELSEKSEVPLTIATGGLSRGADVLISTIAPFFDIEVKNYPIQWKEHDRSRCRCSEDANFCSLAGVRRNEFMFDDFDPELIILLVKPSDLKGLSHLIESAKSKNIQTIVDISFGKKVEDVSAEEFVKV